MTPRLRGRGKYGREKDPVHAGSPHELAGVVTAGTHRHLGRQRRPNGGGSLHGGREVDAVRLEKTRGVDVAVDHEHGARVGGIGSQRATAADHFVGRPPLGPELERRQPRLEKRARPGAELVRIGEASDVGDPVHDAERTRREKAHVTRGYRDPGREAKRRKGLGVIDSPEGDV
jgi:hypothetical protein